MGGNRRSESIDRRLDRTLEELGDDARGSLEQLECSSEYEPQLGVSGARGHTAPRFHDDLLTQGAVHYRLRPDADSTEAVQT